MFRLLSSIRLSKPPTSVVGLSISNVVTRRSIQTHYGQQMASKAVSETCLHNLIMQFPPNPFTQLVAHEWKSSSGQGDIVLKNPTKNSYLVVEAKFLNKRTGRSARTRRNRGRSYVKEQAKRYGFDWKQMYPYASVTYATLTNENGLVPLGVVGELENLNP